MKLSTKIILPIILISALLILLTGCFGVPDDSPGYTPGTTTISGIIAAPCCSTSSAVVSGAPSDWCLQCEQNWFLQKNIEVILTYEGEKIGSTTTNTQGEYTFANLSAGENYVITAICPDNEGYPLVKDVVKEVVDGEDYDAGITDCESTALGIIVDALVNLGISSEYIILEDIQGAVKFESFVEALCEVLESCGDVTVDDNLLDQGNLVLMEILGENPGWTGGEVICVFNPPDDPCIGVPPPTANAGPDQSYEVCPGTNELVDLVGSGSGKGTLSYAWDLDNDGQFDDSAVQSPQDVPFGVGVHTVTLRVTDQCGSTTDEMIVTITESAGVTANAGLDQSEEVCPEAQASIDFTGSGTGTGALSYSWDFDGIGTSTAQNPSGILFGVGTYYVTLTVTDQCDSTSDEMIVTITESAGVTANAGLDQSEEVCPEAQASIDFTGSGTGTGALSYSWDFDGIGTSTAQNPSGILFGVGTYYVTLTVTDQCDSTSDEMIVTITESAGVTANAGLDQSEEVCPEAQASIDFTGSGTGTGALSYSWDFDGIGTSTAQNPSGILFGVGTYYVTLTVTDQCDSTSDEMIVTITESAGVTANAGLDQSEEVCPEAQASIDFTGSGTGTGALSYSWDFDGIGTSTAQNPSGILFGVGTYYVTLTVTDQCDSTSDEMIVTITESAGVTANAGLDQSEEVCPEAQASIDFTGSGTGTGALSYSWDFDGIGTSTAQNPSGILFGVGTYYVTLTVTDQCDSTSDEMIVTITESAGVTANAGLDQSEEVCPEAQASIDFTGSGTGTGALSYSWDFDGIGTSTAQNPSGILFGVGTYYVTLTVTDQCDSTSDEMIVTITESAGVTANAGLDQSEEVCPEAQASIDFTGSGTGTGALSYSWDFDGIGTSTAQNPSGILFGVGTYYVTLTVTDQCDSTSDEMIVTITESAGVTANAGLDQSEEVCPEAQASIDFTGSGTGTGALSYSWDFDGIGTSTAQNPSGILFGVGTYYVTLTVTDQCDSTSDEMIVTITELPALTGVIVEGGPIVLCVGYDRDIGSEITITPEFDGVPGVTMTLAECVACVTCDCSIAITPPDMSYFTISSPTSLLGTAEGIGYITITYSYDGPCGLEFVESEPIEVVVETDRFFLMDNKGNTYGLDINNIPPLITVPHNANHIYFGVSPCNDPDAIIHYQSDRIHCGGSVSEWRQVLGGVVDPEDVLLCNGETTLLMIRITDSVTLSEEFYTFNILRPKTP